MKNDTPNKCSVSHNIFFTFFKPGRLKPFCAGVSFLYLSLYLPIAVMAYFPAWYLFNFSLHEGHSAIGAGTAEKYVHELTGFLKHQGKLMSGWSPKESLHLFEVRDLFDFLFFAAIICLLILALTFEKKKIGGVARNNMLILFLLSGLLLFFGFFWTRIFHPLLFDNAAWKMTPADKLFYMTPRSFFRNSMALSIGMAMLLNASVWLIFRKKFRSTG